YCAANDDLADAEDVCDTLGIPLHRVNFAEEYRQRVFAHFLAEHRRGRTPNPDILCNKEIKFRAFLDHARRLGADHNATGHYARLTRDDDHTRMLKGRDPDKDQSYFLHALSQAQLHDALFPLGDLPKSEVRAIARANDLITHDKKDSTGICFIGERDFQAFLARFLPTRPGPMRTPEGETVGEHQGLAFYTLGQRHGLGIGGRAGDSGEPWYVADKDREHNTLIVVQGDHPLLYRRHLRAGDLHWIGGAPPALPARLRAKTRYRQPDQDCTLVAIDGDQAEVRFDRPQRAVTPGQSVVFYRDDECLGGGVIDAGWN
ncbi:MAG: tRNA 2-thiouridine(34) synthase MnmA, partial [Candidatus Competibacterales bacterium]|nr:tRNA 2-thiouridine(34) synthase MnmA [Candidatus Competibacterales bacterium]